MTDQERYEQVREEALLTDEERKEHEYYRVSGGWSYNLDTLLEAQLAKAEPLIRKGERERIADWLLTQGAVWANKNYAIIETIRKGKSLKEGK